MSISADPLLEDVKHRIEAKYRAALAGLEAIREFVGDPSAHASIQKAPEFQLKNHDDTDSIRARVLSFMNGQWHSVSSLALASGLTEKSVRGALYARKVYESLERRKIGKVLEFRRGGNDK